MQSDNGSGSAERASPDRDSLPDFKLKRKTVLLQYLLANKPRELDYIDMHIHFCTIFIFLIRPCRILPPSLGHSAESILPSEEVE